MAQPQAYNREVDFTERDGDDTNHAGINAELDAAALSINQIRDNLALIQKDDGSLQNGIVGAEQLAQSAFDAIKTDINEAVQDAQQAAESATLAANTAIAARDDAQTAETNAETAAAAALLNANTATTKATEASASATSAAASALASANSATASQTARLASEAARDAAQAAQTAAAASQTAAATSATSAATSATNAATSASTATTQAGIATTQATNAATSAMAAAASFADFNDRYLGAKSTAPTVDNDGNPLQVGTLYYDTTLDQMRVYTPTGWGSASSSVNGTSARFRYIATAGQTTFTGVDSNGNTLAYDAGFVDVYLNGQRLDQTDYTASSGTSIVLASAAAVGDELNIVAFGTFVLANLNAGQVAATDNAGGSLFTTVAGFITRLMSSVGSALIGFIQSGTGAVQRTLQAELRERVNIKQFGGVGDGVNDDTQAFINAKALGRAIHLPPGEWVITQPVAFSVSIFGESAYEARSVIRLDGAGQLIVDDAYMTWRGLYVKSAVNNKTFIKCAHSGWTFEDFRIEKIGAATGQTGIEFDTSARSVYFTALEKFKIRVDYPVKVTGAGTEAFNANKLGGTVRDYWQDFASAITFNGALVSDANHIAGYFENGVNVINVVDGKFRQNRLDLLLDNVTRAYNQSVGLNDVGENFWNIPESQFTWAGQYPKNQYGVPVTRVRATNSTADSIPNASATILKFDTEVLDTLSEFANGSGVFTAKNAGYYQITAAALSASVEWAAGERWELRVYKNGVEYAKGDWNAADALTTQQQMSRVTATVYLNGTTDTVDVRVIHNQGATVALDGSSTGNYIEINRLQ